MRHLTSLLMASGAVSFFVAPPANAQTAPATSSAPVAEAATQDIIVTAQRKNTSLARTPITVAVLSADALAKAQIVTENDLRVAVPGLSIRAGSNSNQLNYSIRGNSQDAFSGTRPGVLPYINDVQIGGSGGSSAFYDLKSVQVLKGPQGTLFGRSATGGAVLFTTAKPTEDLSGYASALVGDYGAKKFEGAISGPLGSSDLLGRIAGFYSEHNGFQHNLYDNSREGDIDKWGVRGSITANFGPDVHNELMVDYYHASGGSMEAVLAGLLPFTGSPPPYIPLALLYSGTATPQATATGIATLQALTGAPLAAATAYYTAYFANPQHPNTGLTGVLAAQQARGPYIIDTNGSNVYRASNYIVSNATTFNIAPDTQIKNIFGFTHIKTFNDFETDGTPYTISQTGDKGTTTGYDNLTRQTSDELQLLGKAFGKKLDYVTGFYFSDEKLTALNFNQFFDLFFGGEEQPKQFVLKNTTYAGYGQGTYQINDAGLAFTLGARYTSEKVEKIKLPGDVDVIANPIAPPGYNYDQSRTFNRLSWQIGVQDQVNPDLLFYAVSRRAYKSGGFVGTSPAKVGYADVAGDAFKAERVTDAEVGAKFQGRLGGMPTRFSTALYYQWIRDSQRTAYTLSEGSPIAVTVNVPYGRAYGAEVDGQIQPTTWLTLGGNINYINSKFGSQPTIANGISQVFDQVPDTPKVTGIAYADITVPVATDLSATLHGDVYGQTKQFTSPRSINSAGTIIDGYAIANFRVSVQDGKAGWTLSANVKNAFNRVYYVGGLPAGEIYQLNLLVPGEPRTYTVEARLKF